MALLPARIVRIVRVMLAVCVAAAAVVLLPGAVSAERARPGIWFAPLPPLQTNESRPYVGSTDFMQLFTKKAAWPSAARRISVFKLYGEWVAHTATPAQLGRAVKDLKRRKISIAVETGPLEPTPDCGQGLEGFAGAEGLETANRIKSAGGTLAYLAFDEPFYYASLYDGRNACHWDARRVAREVAAYVRKIRTVFPNVKFGDIEPLTTGAHVQLYKEWIDAYREMTGENLAFIHLDMNYTLPTWPRFARELEGFTRSRGVAFGLIYFGNYDAVSDGAWLAQAQQRFELYETEGGHPDHAVLQSWHDKPDRALPETKRTFTNLILRYARPRTRLVLEARAGAVEGRLVAAGPLPHAWVRLSVERTFEGSAYPPSGALATASATTSAEGRFRAELATAPPGAAIVARYPGSTRYWPAYAVAGSGASLRNVARGRRVLASAEEATAPAASVVDGDTTTSWNAGQFAPQWVEIDLGTPFAIAAIRLGVAQTPGGDTVHAVLGGPPEGPYRELHVFRGRTTDNELLEYVPPMPWEGIRYLRVETRGSPSWVAWREIEAFAAD
jgi:hypothetical protein